MSKPDQEFGNVVGSQKEVLAAQSVIESQDKQQRLRRFYNQQETSERWVLPNPTFDYLKLFKVEGLKRKDGIKESLLHEIDPCLWTAGLYEGGILPDRVTHQIIDGQTHEIPDPNQSIEHLFATIHTHDTKEEFPDATEAGLKKFLFDKISKTRPDLDLEFLEQLIEFHSDSTEAITFDEKIYDATGQVIRVSKYPDNDRQPYTDALENIWPAIGAKGPDRMGGMVTRYGPIPDLFIYEKQLAYAGETDVLFVQRQTLENMQRRYPDLKEYFDIVNNNLTIAIRCFSAVLSVNPKNSIHSVNPDTARIDLERFLEPAFVGAENIDLDVAPMQAMLTGYKQLAARRPEFSNLVTQMDNQLTSWLAHHPKPLPYPSNENNGGGGKLRSNRIVRTPQIL